MNHVVEHVERGPAAAVPVPVPVPVAVAAPQRGQGGSEEPGHRVVVRKARVEVRVRGEEEEGGERVRVAVQPAPAAAAAALPLAVHVHRLRGTAAVGVIGGVHQEPEERCAGLLPERVRGGWMLRRCGAVRARGEGRPDRLRQGGGRNSTGYLNRNAGVPTGGARGPWATGGGAERGQKRERGGLSTTKVVCSTTRVILARVA